MQDLVYRGIIIKQANYGDAHRMLWIFTESDGIIKAVRYGIRGKKTSNAAAFQLFCYADFKLRPSRGEIMTAVSADVIDGFYPLSEDIVKLSMISYFADITHWLLGENNPDKRICSLFLNAVYAAVYRNEPYIKLKSVYEFKLMCIGGYMPKLDSCSVCGGEAIYFSGSRGSVVCREHHTAADIRINEIVLAVMRYVAGCEDRKMLSFTLSDEKAMKCFEKISEKYIVMQCERNFDSLKYFKSICDM